MVKFFMSEGQRIFSLISSVMRSIGAIASGNISAAVAGVETSLAKSIPVALSFMLRIFKVSGIGTKVKGIINKVKGRIGQVVSRVMNKAAALVAKVVGKGAALANTAKDTLTRYNPTISSFAEHVGASCSLEKEFLEIKEPTTVCVNPAIDEILSFSRRKAG